MLYADAESLANHDGAVGQRASAVQTRARSNGVYAGSIAGSYGIAAALRLDRPFRMRSVTRCL